ncbi:MAG: class I SAM-dependent methyltransferase [Myxococcota bacterium]
MDPAPPSIAVIRRRDLLLTATLLLIALTPSWFLPAAVAVPWQIAVALLGGPMLLLSWTHGPWQPTPPGDTARIISHLGLTEGQRFVDLGSGDGRILLQVAHATGADCTGIEAAPFMVLLSWVRTRFPDRGRIRIRAGDLYRADLSDFDAVYVWGAPYSVGTEGFAESLRARLAEGARVVTYQHPLVGWAATTVDVDGERPIYVYER